MRPILIDPTGKSSKFRRAMFRYYWTYPSRDSIRVRTRPRRAPRRDGPLGSLSLYLTGGTRGMKNMSAPWRTRLGLLGLTWVLAAAAGCQTWTAGMTLPSGFYLDHPPQYIPPSPAFPLTRELSRQDQTNAAVPAGPEGLPAPIPGRP